MVSQLINDNGNPAANQFIISTKKATYFQSYGSVVCKLSHDGKITLSQDWDYSNTTRKHLYMFLRGRGHYGLSSANDIRKAIKEKRVKLDKVDSLAIR
jgi:hypothetical protein